MHEKPNLFFNGELIRYVHVSQAVVPTAAKRKCFYYGGLIPLSGSTVNVDYSPSAASCFVGRESWSSITRPLPFSSFSIGAA